MSNKISEANRLFRYELEPWPFQNLENQIDTLTRIAKLRIHELLPDVPVNWIGEGAFFSERELAFDTMLFGEVVFDSLIHAFHSVAWVQLKNVVLDDLSDRVYQLYQESSVWTNSPYKKFVKSATKKQAMEILIGRFPDLQKSLSNLQNREDQEVNQIRFFILEMLIREGRLEELKMRGESRGKSKESLEKNVGAHLDFIYALGTAEYSRVAALKKEEIEMKEVLEEEGSTIDIQTHQEVEPVEQGALSMQSSAKELGIEMPLELARQVVGSKTYKKPGKCLFPWGQQASYAASRVVSYLLPMFHEEANNSKRRYAVVLGRLREVSEQQSEVMKGQKILGDQLTQINAKLEGIAADQRRIAEALPLIVNQIQQNHVELMRAQAIMTHEVVLTRVLVQLMLDEGGNACRHIRWQLKFDKGYNPVLNRFISYAAFSSFYKRELIFMEAGLKGLPKLLSFAKMDEGEKVFAVKGNENESAMLSRYFQELVDFYASEKKREGIKGFEFLLATHTDVEGLERNEVAFQTKERPELPDWMKSHFQKPLKKIFSVLYDVETLIDYTESARTIHYFYEMLEGLPGGALLSHASLKESESRLTGMQMLQDIFIRLEIAIAQCNLLSGSGMLPAIYTNFQQEKVKHLLVGNSMLAKNFIVYAFRKRMEEKSKSFTNYYFPYKMSENPKPLQELFGNDWNFVWNKEQEKWSIQFVEGKGSLGLPTPVEIINGSLEIHPHIPELHIMRKRVLRELAGYQTKDLSSEPLKLEFYGLVLTSLFFRKVNDMQRSAL